ncbi:MAG: ribonuclease HII [Flavobacteriaceae bacterium]
MLKTQFTSLLEAGVDEAGRGCLAGPVTAAVVILPKGITLPQINDSKILTEKKRYNLRSLIEKCAIDFQVAHVFQDEIDKINILNSTIKAMHLAIKKLKETPQYIIVDGNKFYPYKEVPYKCIVKGDGKYQNIAAASILAKTYRDDYMRKIEHKFPEYGWNKNKGYPTVTHRKAIEKFGITEHHRNSFKLLN